MAMSAATKAENEHYGDGNERDIKLFQPIILKQEPCFGPVRCDSDEMMSTLDTTAESPIFFNKPYKIKDPIVLLERCDKIWETMQLIKQQIPQQEACQEELKFQQTLEQSPNNKSSSTDRSAAPYIKYQPVLSNGNKALPNFRFSVQKMKKLFHCNNCGKLFVEKRSLRIHSLKIHGIFIEPKNYRKPVVNDRNDKNKTDAVDVTKLQTVEDSVDKDKKTTTKRRLEDIRDVNSCKSVSNQNHKIHSRSKVHDCTSRNNNNNNIVNSSTENSGQATIVKSGNSEQKTHSLAFAKCPLCERNVKYMRRHLVDYHKINTPDVIIKSLQTEQSKNDSFMQHKLPQRLNENAQTRIAAENKSDTDNKLEAYTHPLQTNTVQNQKRKKSLSTLAAKAKKSKSYDNQSVEKEAASNITIVSDDKILCEVCLGFYTRGSIHGHRLMHRSRGETKDNFGEMTCPYYNSPMCFTRFRNQETSNDETNNGVLEQEEVDDYLQKNEPANVSARKINRTNTKLYEHSETSCSCGRNFRNPHTLYIHKRNCKRSEEEGLQQRNSSDRDSGIGINITIKKKDNSYEIVGKGSEDEDRLKGTDEEYSSDSSDIAFIDLNDATERNCQMVLSKYSRDHSVIIVKHLNEDINVDIEGNSQVDDPSDENIDQLHMNKDDSKVEENLKSEKSAKVMESHYRKIPSLRVLCRAALHGQNFIEENHIHKCNICNQLCTDEKDLQAHSLSCCQSSGEVCICGRVFTNTKSLKLHTKRVHRALLMCAYCKQTLNSIREYMDHHCDAHGSEYSESQEEIICPYCESILTNSNKFDEHIKLQHFDQTLPYQCHKCLQRFPNKPQRLLHFRKEHTVEAFCDFCRKKISNLMLLKHESYHKGIGFPCHPCKKAYCTKVALLRHVMLSHSDTKNNSVMCTICKKSITLKAFRRHLNIHTPFMTCVLCDKSFYDELQLEDHIMKIHKEKYPRVTCRSCGMSFSTPLALQKHTQTEDCYKYSKNSMEEEMLCDI